MDKRSKENFSRMAAALAHEVKNPVALIKANVELIEKCSGTEEYSSNILSIKSQLKKINSIVSDFIRLTRSSETDNEEKEQVFIYDLINEITDEYNTRKEISFETKTDDEDIGIFSNYTKLYILFSNIYKNAVEAIGEKGFITTNISSHNDSIVVTVSDSGSGLEDYVLQRLYEPFVTTKKEGSGLGLAICKSIAEEFNGSFSIRNKREGGCETKIILKKTKRT